jgi:hypothetical protein
MANLFAALWKVCVCTTENCADVTASCQLSMNYADYSYPLNDSSAIGEGEAYVSVGAASQVGLIRSNELAAGVINHAIWLGTSCEAAGAVFPSLGGQALTCDSQTNRPHAGSLFKISSSFNCSAVNPQELRAVCVAMQTYGGYLSDTSGPSSGNGATLIANRIEGGAAYAYVGAPSPALQQMANDANGRQCSAAAPKLTLRRHPVRFNSLTSPGSSPVTTWRLLILASRFSWRESPAAAHRNDPCKSVALSRATFQK